MTKPANKRLNRAVYGVFIALAVVFIVTCTAQIAEAVFRLPTATPQVGDACGEHLHALIAGVDAALAAAERETDGEAAKRAYVEVRRVAWSTHADTAARCATDPHAPEALAAVARYDRAAETFAAARVSRRSELSPVRLRAQSFIRQGSR